MAVRTLADRRHDQPHCRLIDGIDQLNGVVVQWALRQLLGSSFQLRELKVSADPIPRSAIHVQRSANSAFGEKRAA